MEVVVKEQKKTMTRTKKLLGFRLNEPIPEWRDKFGKGGGRVIKITPLNYFDPPKYQITVSNGDFLTNRIHLYPDEWRYTRDFLSKPL